MGNTNSYDNSNDDDDKNEKENDSSKINELENILFQYDDFYSSYNVNVIYFDKKLNSEELYHYFFELKSCVKGAFFGTSDIKSYDKILSLIKSYDNIPPFILIYTGNDPEEILSRSHDKEFIYDILLFKSNKEKNKNLFKKYPKIRKIEENNFDIILNFLNEKDYITNQNEKIISYLKPEKLITLDDYYRYYFLFHKLISNYYDDDNKIPSLTKTEKTKFLNQINQLEDLNLIEKKEIENEINSLKNNNDFIKKIIELYTKETQLSYSINKLLLSLNPNNYINIKSYIGKFMYSLYKYAKDNPSKKFNNQLRRAISMKKSDLYLYKACEGNIIILPGFTSTSEKLLIGRLRTFMGKYIYKNNNKILEYVEMIIKFTKNPFNNEILAVNISSISSQPYEEEILFPPFSFFKINKVVFKSGVINDPHQIFVEVINKKCNIESKIKIGRKVYYDPKLNCILTN